MFKAVFILSALAVGCFGASEGPQPNGPCDVVAQQEIDKLAELEAQNYVVDSFHIPQCDENGLWKSEQSTSDFMGHVTWCVIPTTGQEIEGSRLVNTEREFECHARG